jgi:iron complex transport system substrate-binding protein
VRIVSLLPSATEIVCELGLESELVGITHECDYPPSIRGKPVLTASLLDGSPDSTTIDRHIRSMVHEGSSIYRLDADRLDALHPDLVLTQELCEVCAVSYPIVERAVRRLDGACQLVSLEPETLEDVYQTIRTVGRLAKRGAEAEKLVEQLQLRINGLARRLRDCAPRRVLCLEWIDPPYNCGHWTPQLVEFAGGRAVLGYRGQPARPLTADELKAAHPEVVVVMACGFGLPRSIEEVDRHRDELSFDGAELWVVDGNAYFSRPGPRLVDSVEILAGILHPDAVDPPMADAAERLS